ncbi:MAG: molybdopterin-synthase adenylyltransferase MoeB [Plesiomonas sp.]|uniref:molybdopterin-synthase adenylyltransferase MoeB n=1 Tax=Plesiomonas sp. TaxID=2486279 RepID=UPI003F34402D
MQTELSDAETLRYNRQIVLRECDFDGQEKLKAALVLIVGLGGLGCAAAQYLAAAGVGSLTLLDFDTVSLSNLQRQVLHRDTRIGMPKVESAATELRAINPHIRVEPLNGKLEDDDLFTLITQHDLVLDCTDNVDTRNQLNQLCFNSKTTLISGAAIRFEGQLSVFTYAEGQPCYRCLSRLFGDNALSCVEAGVIAPIVGVVGNLQALEAIKYITQIGQVLAGKLLLIDGRTLQFREMALPRFADCDVCSHHNADSDHYSTQNACTDRTNNQ